jgi:tetratricopeptide (TPR) repeat protein
MRKLIILLELVIFCFINQVYYGIDKGCTLRGIVTLQNSGGRPVQNVNINVFGAKPTTSDSFGMFRLVFAAKKPGDRVVLIVVKKGMEVVNRNELKVTLSSKPDDVQVRIVMCKIGERDKYAREYYDIAEQNINKNFEKIFKEIKNRNITIEEKNKKIAQLEEDKKAALAQIKDLSETFAKIDLDQASRLYKEAFAYFTKGEIDKAFATLDDAKIEEAVCQAREEKRKADESIKKSADSYVLKAQLSIIKLRFAQAENYFKKAIRLDPYNIINVGTYANFYLGQNQYNKALSLYKKALTISRDKYDRSITLNNMGNLYSDTSRFREAENAYNEALKIRRELAEKNKNAYLPYVATSLNNLGLLYIGSKRYTEAVKALNEALEIREKLAAENPDAFNIDLCDTSIPLSGLYILTSNEESIRANLNKALSMLNRAISILEKYPHVPRAQSLLEIAKKLKEMYLILVKK